MAAFFISVAFIVIALIVAVCFLVAELFWPLVAIIVIVLLGKLISQRITERNNVSGTTKPFDEERD